MTKGELAKLTADLPERFADRLSVSDLDGLRSMAGGGEWDELLDLLIAALQQEQTQISHHERDLLREVLTGWDMPTGLLDGLNVAD